MNLTDYMKTNGIKPKALAEQVGLPTTVITRFIKEERGLSPASAAKISAGTSGQVSVEELLYPKGALPGARIAANN